MRIMIIPFACILATYSCGEEIEKLSIDSKDNALTNYVKHIDLKEDERSNYTDSLNHYDVNGLKQGKHITRNKWGKIIEEATYRNDTIVGYYSYWDGMQKDGYYLGGKKDGNFNWYYDNGTILLITHYEKDSIIWHAPYIANQHHVLPFKTITVLKDSVYIEVPHPNHKIWYEGLFIHHDPVGIHNVYYNSGALRGQINYDEMSYTECDSNGQEIKTNDLFKFW